MQGLPNRLIPCLLAVLLVACGGNDADGDDRSASGEVLEGTISDAMLPLDSVRSQAPRAQPEAAASQPVSEDDAVEAESVAETEEVPDEAPPAE